jgi:hypothetical protein
MKRALRTLLSITLVAVVTNMILFAPLPVLAQDPVDPDPGLKGGLDHLQDKTRAAAGIREFSGGPVELALIIINIALALVAVVATGILIWAGISYVISLGNEEKIATAKRMLLFTIVGLMIVGLAAVLVNLILNIFIAPGAAGP